jgi:hypothetical protein
MVSLCVSGDYHDHHDDPGGLLHLPEHMRGLVAAAAQEVTAR